MLPRVSTIATWPFLCTERKWCGRAAAWIASMAIWMLPSVPFLKPTGTDRPEASSRWTWLSVVRAPIAPQAIRSPRYCGEMTSRNSLPAGMPSSLISSSSWRADAQALVDAIALVEVGVVDEPLPADRRARLLEVDAHHDLERAGEAVALGLEPLGVLDAPRAGRGSSTAPRSRAGGRRRARMMRRIESRVVAISVSTGVPAIGKKRIRCSGGGSGVTFSIRRSSVRLVRSPRHTRFRHRVC